MHPLDKIILDHNPLIAEPDYGKRWPMAANSHRFVGGHDGFYLEVERPWVRAICLIAPSEIPLPYGVVSDFVEFSFDTNAINAIVHMFVSDAREALPNESAAWAIWDTRDQRLHYRLLDPLEAGPAGIRFNRPVLDHAEHLAIDLHSHADLPAGWSETDDHDDAGETKLAIVVGNVNDAHPSSRARMCLRGLFIDLDPPL